MFPASSATVLFVANYYSNAHVIVNQGGTNSGKTYAILQALFSIAYLQSEQVITVVGQDIPNLKAGVLRDALKIYGNSSQIASMVKSYNHSERLFEFNNKTAKYTGADNQSGESVMILL